jgi:hypothetical protein
MVRHLAAPVAVTEPSAEVAYMPVTGVIAAAATLTSPTDTVALTPVTEKVCPALTDLDQRYQ